MTASSWFWIAVVAVAPIAWGSTYYVTRQFLSPDHPVWGAALRALPAGLMLLLLARRLPRGGEWWRSITLGLLNFSGFFVLVYLAAVLLPSSVAASVMALAPFALAGLGALILHEKLSAWTMMGATAGLVGVLLIVGLGAERVPPAGVAASAFALLCSALGAVLTKKWRGRTPVLAFSAWQLTAGGLALVAVAVAVEGAPPALDGGGIVATLYLTLIATALASVCWFSGLAHLPAGVVGTVGLLNPVTGVVLGAVLAGEALTAAQWGGIGLVVGGVLLGQRATRRSAASGVRASVEA